MNLAKLQEGLWREGLLQVIPFKMFKYLLAFSAPFRYLCRNNLLHDSTAESDCQHSFSIKCKHMGVDFISLISNITKVL